MTGLKLFQWLKKSGTGENKLKAPRALLHEDANASAEAVIDAMVRAGVTEVTVAKARRIVAKGRWDSFDDPIRAVLAQTDFDKRLNADPEADSKADASPASNVIPAMQEVKVDAAPVIGPQKVTRK